MSLLSVLEPKAHKSKDLTQPEYAAWRKAEKLATWARGGVFEVYRSNGAYLVLQAGEEAPQWAKRLVAMKISMRI